MSLLTKKTRNSESRRSLSRMASRCEVCGSRASRWKMPSLAWWRRHSNVEWRSRDVANSGPNPEGVDADRARLAHAATRAHPPVNPAHAARQRNLTFSHGHTSGGPGSRRLTIFARVDRCLSFVVNTARRTLAHKQTTG